MHVVLWRFRARAGCEAEFEAAYGDGGTWSSLFREAPGYLGTDLLRSRDGTYLSMDRWQSEEAYRSFRDARRAEYDALDAACAPLTDEETELGEVEV